MLTPLTFPLFLLFFTTFQFLIPSLILYLCYLLCSVSNYPWFTISSDPLCSRLMLLSYTLVPHALESCVDLTSCCLITPPIVLCSLSMISSPHYPNLLYINSVFSSTQTNMIIAFYFVPLHSSILLLQLLLFTSP